MSSNISATHILDLIRISDTLSSEKKEWWKKELPQMDDFQKAQFVRILEKEAKSKIDMLRKNASIKKEYAQKKVKALYSYIEEKIEKEEEIELALLDKELENA